MLGKGTVLEKPFIRIVGNNNTIEFGEQCIMGRNCTFWLDGNNMKVKIGSRSTFTHDCNFTCQEDGMTITVGEDCMFSHAIVVRTSDSHEMIDLSTHLRTNPPRPVAIGNHVWIAPDTKIMKGASIGEGSIVVSDTTVSHPMPDHCLIVGRPARIVKQGITWTRKSLF